MPFLTETNYSLLDLVDIEKTKYERIKKHFNPICKTNYIMKTIDKCREIMNSISIGTFPFLINSLFGYSRSYLSKEFFEYFNGLAHFL